MVGGIVTETTEKWLIFRIKEKLIQTNKENQLTKGKMNKQHSLNGKC